MGNPEKIRTIAIMDCNIVKPIKDSYNNHRDKITPPSGIKYLPGGTKINSLDFLINAEADAEEIT